MKNKVIGNILIIILSIVLGLFLSTQFKQNIEQYDLISLKSIQMMKNEVNNKRKEIKELKILIDKKEKELFKLKNIVENEGDIVSMLEEQVENVKLTAGFNDVEGPGIIIKMSDNADDEIVSGNVNYDIIHDLDVLNIINDLRIAGAEAISISGQRLLSNSEIKCGGPIIRINEKSLATPFYIKAIGDPKLLYAAINAPGTYGDALKNVYKINIETTMKYNIYIPRYWGDTTFKYANIKKEGE